VYAPFLTVQDRRAAPRPPRVHVSVQRRRSARILPHHDRLARRLPSGSSRSSPNTSPNAARSCPRDGPAGCDSAVCRSHGFVIVPSQVPCSSSRGDHVKVQPPPAGVRSSARRRNTACPASLMRRPKPDDPLLPGHQSKVLRQGELRPLDSGSGSRSGPRTALNLTINRFVSALRSPDQLYLKYPLTSRIQCTSAVDHRRWQ